MRCLSKLCKTPKRIFFNLTLQKNRPEWYIRDTCGQVCAAITWLLILYGQFVVFYVIIPPFYRSDNAKLSQLASKLNLLQSEDAISTEDLVHKIRNSKSNLDLAISETEFNSITNAHASIFSHSSFRATLHGLLFFIFGLFAFVSHVKAMFTDPGSTEKNNASPESIAKMNLPSGHVLYKCTKCAAIKPERAHHCSVCRRCIKKMDHHCPWINNCVGEKNQKYFVLFTFYICLILETSRN